MSLFDKEKLRNIIIAIVLILFSRIFLTSLFELDVYKRQENNYETAIREFMASSTKRDLVIICNHEGNPYFEELRARTGFDQDPRVKFVGTVYDQDLLKYIRKEAFAYIHGHEVGGTNPGLLELSLIHI